MVQNMSSQSNMHQVTTHQWVSLRNIELNNQNAFQVQLPLECLSEVKKNEAIFGVSYVNFDRIHTSFQ